MDMKVSLCEKTSTSLLDGIPRLYHFHESLSMRYTFASTSTLCLVPLTVLGQLEPKQVSALSDPGKADL